MVLRIQPHYHPMPKGDGLSRSEMAVISSILLIEITYFYGSGAKNPK